MKIRPIYAIGSLSILITLGAFLWGILQLKDKSPIVIYKYKAVTPEPRTTQTTQEFPPPQEESSLTVGEKAEQSKVLLSILQDDSDPYTQKLQKALNSPEYLEYLKSQEGTFGVNLTAWWDFLESQGLNSGRSLQEKEFRKRFPVGDAADYEPEMRKKIAELSLANPELDTVGLLQAFWRQDEDRSNYIWSRQQFNGHVGDFDWVENIRQNAASILSEFTLTEAEVDSAPLPTTSTFTPEFGPIDSIEESTDTASAPRADTITLTDIEPISQSSEAELTKNIFADVPNLSTNADFEKTLRERFSPERFTTAMQTLTQYGPKEGLQRLKESDPEVAIHIERFLQPSKETDANEK
ncbi:MAG: hypothetical protein OXU27_18320 [Candidatus Poribacteria bacterium]|nr:hypothetical protein [Candidatus Poribacteria bacterium]